MTATESAAETACAALPSVNALAAPLTEGLRRDAAALRLGLERLDNGAMVIDAGIDRPGGLEAGRRIAEVCLGGLGRVTLHGAGFDARWPLALSVHSSHPVLGCLASQYAGWSLALEDRGKAFQALGSGPARALAQKEPLFAELGYRDRAEATSLVLEVDRRPPPALAEKIARDCGLAPAGVTLILTPTRSLAGTVQVVARVLEVALHKAHALGFPLEQIVDGQGSAPLPPPSPDVVTGMGRTNDAILYGGQVHLFVHGSDADAQRLAWALPSSASRDYGKPFATVFRDYDGDFFRIDPLLFSPARVVVTALASGNSFLAGRIDRELIDRSFGGGT